LGNGGSNDPRNGVALCDRKQLWRWYRSQVGYVQWVAAIVLLFVFAAGFNLFRGGHLDERRNVERLLETTRGDEAVETVRCSRSGSQYLCRVKCDDGRSFVVRVPVGGGEVRSRREC
jgi:hypothetical protein